VKAGGSTIEDAFLDRFIKGFTGGAFR